MRPTIRSVACLLVAFVAGVLAAAPAAAEEPLRPDRFGIIFNMGYAGDHLPQDKESFEKLIVAVKQAHFNVVWCQYEDWRAEICKKHDVQIMVDLLVGDHHVYKNVEACQKLCDHLKDNDVVYAYHIWSDNISSTYPGRSRDANNVRTWDGTHPVYVGCYAMSRISRVQNNDLFGYYDFHWKRGGHWAHLAKAAGIAQGNHTYFLRYCDAAPGRVGAGNVNRAGWTIATSVPFGLKGYTYHYGGGVVDPGSGELDALGKDLQAVNAKFAAIGDEVMKIGNPIAVYSTPVTKTEKDRPTGTDPAVPAGLTALPGELSFKINSGEVLLGLFSDKEKNNVVALASHNAYQPQHVTLEFKSPVQQCSFFNRDTKSWEALQVTDNRVEFDVDVFATELVRFGQ